MKMILTLTLLALMQDLHSQLIEGRVFDKSSGEQVCCASVYFNGTSRGTLTDQEGKFRIDISGFRSMPLTISAMGYYSVSITDFAPGKFLNVYIIQKLLELDEVVVNARSMARERKANMSVFRNEFLGTTANAMSCEIQNEKDIRFRSSADGDTLIAFAVNPIHIINRALGYDITYFLDNFEYHRQEKTFFYKGNILYKPDSAIIANQYNAVERRRRFAYLGSRMHFFRSLWLNDLNISGFSMYNISYTRIHFPDVVIEKDAHTRFLNFKGTIGVGYYTEMPTSFIRFLKSPVYFDPNGYFDASAIIWEGEMAAQRLADSLPYDYVPDK